MQNFPPERILLLSRVTAARLNVPSHLRDDAASEATEAGLRALGTWREGRGAALEPWVILHMRYAVRDLLAKERSRPVVYNAPERPQKRHPARYSWEDVREALAGLREPSRTLLGMTALGYPMKDISHHLKMSGPQIAAKRAEARAELLEALA